MNTWIRKNPLTRRWIPYNPLIFLGQVSMLGAFCDSIMIRIAWSYI